MTISSNDTAAPAFGLLVIGDEILSGRRQDKHLPRVIELLAARGLALAWAQYVGDDPARITATLRRVLATGDVVFSTGGIGATPDDHTRQCAAAALGVPLAPHPEAQALIEQRGREVAAEKGQPYDPARADNVQRLQMGVLPAGAALIPNPYNRIPGFSCRGPGGGAVYFTPGFPVMAWPMVQWVLDTHCVHWFRQPGAWRERSLIVRGAAESVLTPVMVRVEAAHPRVKVFSLPSVAHPEWGPHIDLGVKGPADAVDAAFADLKAWLAPFKLEMGPELVR
jgi:molybdopterin-biosynthesis enzyme MoeA-like protein